MLTTWFSSVYGSFPCWPKTVVLAATWKKQTNELQSWEKVLGHLFICGNYLKSPTPNPFPTQQTMLNVYMSIQIFSRVSTLYRVRRGEKRELRYFQKGFTVLWWYPELQKVTNTASLSPGLLVRIVLYSHSKRKLLNIPFLWKIWYTKTVT